MSKLDYARAVLFDEPPVQAPWEGCHVETAADRAWIAAGGVIAVAAVALAYAMGGM